ENLVISTDWPTAIPLFHRLSIPFSRSTACPTSPGAKFFGTTARDFTTFALDLWTQVPSYCLHRGSAAWYKHCQHEQHSTSRADRLDHRGRSGGAKRIGNADRFLRACLVFLPAAGTRQYRYRYIASGL